MAQEISVRSFAQHSISEGMSKSDSNRKSTSSGFSVLIEWCAAQHVRRILAGSQVQCIDEVVGKPALMQQQVSVVHVPKNMYKPLRCKSSDERYGHCSRATNTGSHDSTAGFVEQSFGRARGGSTAGASHWKCHSCSSVTRSSTSQL